MTVPRLEPTREIEAIARVRLACWGEFAIVDRITGDEVKLRGRKARALLAYLALHPGKNVSRDRITGLLWGDRADEQARASLRQTIWELKLFAAGGYDILIVDRDHLTLRAGSVATDVDEMRSAAASGRYDALLDLLPEPDDRLFANLDGIDETFDEWLREERSRRDDELIALIADSSAAALAIGQTRVARALHQRRGLIDPTIRHKVPIPASDGPAVDRLVARRSADAPAISERPPSNRSRITALGAGFIALLAILATLWATTRVRPAEPATIAVLPFTSPSSENGAFVAGLSEEITAQLARQPGLRLAGHSSAEQFRGRGASLAEVGRKLHVRYVLEGNVRSAGNHIRVTVALTKAADGLQLWSETFDERIDDALAIQDRIASRVAQSLNLKLTGVQPRSGALTTSGQAYSAYLTARGLIRERNGTAFEQARAKLHEAVRADPNFAPAWASLAQAENPGGIGTDVPRAMTLAIGHARKALSLAPDFAQAHGVLGMLLGFDAPEGRAHIERAAALDPNNAEFQFWLGNVYAANADFARMTEAYRRAYDLDPLWYYAQASAVTSSWQMGDRARAQAIVRQVEMDGTPYQAHVIRSILAHMRGDFSAEAQELGAARDATADSGRKSTADAGRGMVYEQVGLAEAAYRIWLRCNIPQKLLPPSSDPLEQVRRGVLPTLGELRQHDRQAPAYWREMGYMGRAAKQLVNAGRAADIVRLYDGDGIMRLSRRQLPQQPARVLEDGPVVAAALRSVGRHQDADRMLASLDLQISDAMRRSHGRVPGPFLASAAQTWALLGKRNEALSALEQAVANGWVYVIEYDDSSLSDFGQEPALRSLRGDPRFEAIRARINGNIAHERAELEADLRRQPTN